MQRTLRPFLSVAAAMVVAIHTVLWAGVTPLAAGPSVDPFAVICHSDASAPAEQAPTPGPLTPAHACDHCNLCSGVAPLLPPPDAIVAARFAPMRIMRVTRLFNIPHHGNVASDPKLARGPPIVA